MIGCLCVGLLSKSILARQFEPQCLIFKTVSLDFSGFQVYQKAKTVDNTITVSELIAYCLPLFLHIHRPKADSRHRQLMAEGLNRFAVGVQLFKLADD